MMKKLKINMISESEFSVKGHGVHTAYLELTNALKKRQDTDVVVNHMRHSADITHIQTVGPYSLMHLLFGPGKKVVSAHIVPASFIGSLVGAQYWLPLSKLYLRFFYGRADKVFAVSGSVANVLINELGVKAEKVSTFYNTIDMAQYQTTEADKATARKALGIDDDIFVVVGNGQVQPRKRVDVLTKMAKKMPDVRFFWVGGIPFKRLGADAQVMQKLMDNTPKNMTVTGVIDLKDVKRYYQAADVFVLPATQENHPMCVLEAAGAGLPIVLRQIPEYDDTFKGKALLAADDDEFANIVERLRTDKDYRTQACSGSKAITERFDSKTGAEEAVAIYKTLL